MGSPASNLIDKNSAAIGQVTQRAAWTVNEWCREARIGRVRCYEEIRLGRIVAKKCGSRTLIATSPKEWIDSLPVKAVRSCGAS